MWRLARGLGLVLFLCFPALCQERYIVEKLPSRNLGERTVRVYLPPSYGTNTAGRYAVLYLHDGQNVFSFAGTNVAFGWGSWELDRTADRRASEGKMQEIIMIAVDNSPARLAEYGGAHHSGTNELTPYEKYEGFLIKELKPAIDSRYRTRSKPADTAVMGSSMGGLCSLVLAWEHPEVFGGAASLSGAFMMNHTNLLNSVLRPYQGPNKDLRIYLDCGSVDFMGGDDGRRLTTQVAEELRRIGYQDSLPDSLGKGLSQRKPAVMLFVDEKPLSEGELPKTGLRRDKWKEAEISQHNEFYWRLRAWRSLEFLFPPVVP